MTVYLQTWSIVAVGLFEHAVRFEHVAPVSKFEGSKFTRGGLRLGQEPIQTCRGRDMPRLPRSSSGTCRKRSSQVTIQQRSEKEDAKAGGIQGTVVSAALTHSREAKKPRFRPAFPRVCTYGRAEGQGKKLAQISPCTRLLA